MSFALRESVRGFLRRLHDLDLTMKTFAEKRLWLAAVVAAGLAFVSLADGTAVGSWWWSGRTVGDRRATSAKLDFLAAQGVNEIYVCADWKTPREELAGFVRAAGAQGMSVRCLAGDPSWIRPGNLGFETAFSAYRQYQRSVPADARFAGLHLDVEPHVDRKLSDARKWQLYADLAVRAGAMARRAGEKIEWDVPFWLDGIAVQYGEREAVPLLEVLMENADGITLMSYRDTAKAILDCGATELAMGRTRNCRVLLGVETGKSDEGGFVTFREEGRKALAKTLTEVKAAVAAAGLRAGGGVAVHHVDAWMDLQD